jgi:hypothetical protein
MQYFLSFTKSKIIDLYTSLSLLLVLKDDIIVSILDIILDIINNIVSDIVTIIDNDNSNKVII